MLELRAPLVDAEVGTLARQNRHPTRARTREGAECADDRLDKSIYDYAGECYYETIYVQGDQYINNYRLTVGNDNFWAALQDFYRVNKFGGVTTREFWDFMDAETGFAGSHAQRFPSLYP